MKLRTRFLFILLLSLLPLAFAQTQQSAPFSLSITPAQASVKSGSPVELEVITTNLSPQPITLSKSNPGMEYDFDVRDSGKKAAPMSPQLKRMRDPAHPHGVFRLFGKVLQPQESLRETVTISEYYDMSKPGTYTIRLQREIPEQVGKGVVKSNAVSVKITP